MSLSGSVSPSDITLLFLALRSDLCRVRGLVPIELEMKDRQLVRCFTDVNQTIPQEERCSETDHINLILSESTIYMVTAFRLKFRQKISARF